MAAVSRETAFVVPTTLIEDYATPDSLPFSVYNESNTLVDRGMANDVTGTSIARGNKIRVRYIVNLPDVAGDYAVEFDIDSKFAHTDTVYVDGVPECTKDHFTMDDRIEVELVENLGPTINAKLYRDNHAVENAATVVGSTVRVDLSNVAVSLDPYNLIAEGDNGYVNIRVWKVNATILGAMEDVRVFVDRLNRKLRIDGLQFEDTDYLLCMRTGKDEFNAIPAATDFNMTKAEGPIRALWVLSSQEVVLRTRYLEEGLTSYSYNGAAVTLEVETTSFLETQANTLKEQLQERGEALKRALWQRGVTGGDGQWTTAHRALSANGFSLSPVSGRRSLLYGR